MKRKRVWAAILAASMAVSMLGGCAARPRVTEDMIPTVTDLRAGETQEEETEASVMQLSMNKSYVAELTRLDGDNTEKAQVSAKEVSVVSKATSMDKDLKVKIVNAKNDRVITGTPFEVTVTDVNKKTSTYKDDDKDGIIYIKNMAPGKCSVAMKSSGSYSAPEPITADVKANLEYKVVDVGDEIKKESEINVAGEDSNSNGNNGAGTAVVLQDTVEFVPSNKTEIMKEEKVQKKDKWGQPIFSKLKKDANGADIYEGILSEPTHDDNDGDGLCDRCKGEMPKPHEHTFDAGTVTTEPTCTAEGVKTFVCTGAGCGEKKTEPVPALGHTDDGNGTCSVCGEILKAPDPGETAPPEGTPSDSTAASVMLHRVLLVAAPVKTTPTTVYDTSSKPVYDTSSAPVYETKQVGTGTYKYTGWQTIDGATYYYDKNGNKVTGTQVIQGVQYTFSSSGVRSGTVGIDVSKFQSAINWTKVKNAGINFVMIRCGYRGYGTGVLVEDPMFASHITGAKAAGLRVGVYFFSQAVNEAEAVEEASMAVKLANRYGINMPIAIDSEYAAGGAGRADGLSKSARTSVTKAFCNTVASAGHTPMVYASKSWFSDHLNVSQFPGSYRIWVAHYADKCGYSGRYDMWQYTSKGRVDGVSGNVDMNNSSI